VNCEAQEERQGVPSARARSVRALPPPTRPGIQPGLFFVHKGRPVTDIRRFPEAAPSAEDRNLRRAGGRAARGVLSKKLHHILPLFARVLMNDLLPKEENLKGQRQL
jgi:hypothetical protein